MVLGFRVFAFRVLGGGGPRDEIRVWGFRVCKIRELSPVENQTEQNMFNEMATGLMQRFTVFRISKN